MKTKLMLMVALMCFVGADVSANLVDVGVSEDAHIERRTEDPEVSLTTNYGGNATLDLAWNRGGSNIYRKAYVKFDASAYNPDDISEIVSLSFYLTSSADKMISVWFLSPLNGIDDNWDEGTITWENAPYNDGTSYGPLGTADARRFNNDGGAGEQVDDLAGGGNDWILSNGWNTLDLSYLSQARRDAMLAGLKADGFITFGLALDYSGQVGAVSSKEGLNPGYMTIVVPEPATLVMLGLGGLSLLRKRK